MEVFAGFVDDLVAVAERSGGGVTAPELSKLWTAHVSDGPDAAAVPVSDFGMPSRGSDVEGDLQLLLGALVELGLVLLVEESAEFE